MITIDSCTCGHTNPIVSEIPMPEPDRPDAVAYYLFCPRCRRRGAYRVTPDRAVQWWNADRERRVQP